MSKKLEHLAKQVKNQTKPPSQYVKATKGKDTNKYIPKPPPNGEIMKCRNCGKDMPPESFPENLTLAKVLFKWQICESCYNDVGDLLDRSTPGLSSDRGFK